MAQTDCEITTEVRDAYKNLKFSKTKTNKLLVLKVNQKELTMEIDEEYEDISLEELAEELTPSSHRFIIYSFKRTHHDGRISYPLVFIHYAPSSAPMAHNMLYSRMKPPIIELFEIQRKFEVNDLEDLNDEWLLDRLGK